MGVVTLGGGIGVGGGFVEGGLLEGRCFGNLHGFWFKFKGFELNLCLFSVCFFGGFK